MDYSQVAEIGQSKFKRVPEAKWYNILSSLFFCWLDPLFWTGCDHTLEQSDLYTHPSDSDSKLLLKCFNRHWKTELDRKKHGRKPRLLFAVIKCLWWRILLQGFLFFFETSCQVVQSVLLGYLVNAFNGVSFDGTTAVNSSVNQTLPEEISKDAYFYAAGVSLLSFIVLVLHGHAFLLGYKLGMMTRIIMTGAIYQKVLSMRQVTVGRLSIGHIVNLASNDVQRFDLAFIPLHVLWIAPIHLAVVTYLVYLEIGWASFIMTGFVCFQVPIQIFAGRCFAKLRLKSAVITDKRIRIMNEVITGIRVIKMYAWEYAFKRVITNLRKRESLIILHAGLVRAASLAFMIVSLSILMYIVFTAYTATGGEITPKKLFTTLALFTFLRLTSIHFLVQAVLSIVESRVALVRLQKLLEIDELDVQKELPNVEEHSILAKNLSASWGDESKLVLSDVNFSVTKELRLMAVVGPVGSGKSTLLQCLLNELKPVEGSVHLNGSVSYASQDPWIYSATIRENVLFGKPYDEKFYSRVIKACALDKDIELFVEGDRTLVGERGVTLSGGQKARVSLARAVYHDADIYLLDDPLSAVDASVGKHLFEECICGLLKDRLVILVTHQVHLALLADKILVLKDGHVEAYGSHSDLLHKGLDPKHLLGLISTDNLTDDACVANEPAIGQSDVSSLSLHRKHLIHLNSSSPGQLRRNQPASLDVILDGASILCDMTSLFGHSMMSLNSSLETQSVQDGIGDNEHRVSISSEDRETGTISNKTYYYYFRAGGSGIFVIGTFLTLLLGEVGIVVSDWWLADWARCNVAPDSSSSTCSLTTNERIYIHSGLTLHAVIMSFIRAMAFYYICVNASRVLHNRMFQAILRVPVLFFDTNPSGRILNRFSKDVGFLDDLLPYIFCEFILFFLRSGAIIITALVANWIVLFPAILLVVGMFFIRWYYLKTSREVKRLEAISRSPLYSHLSTTLQGLPTVRAFQKQEIAIQLFHNFQNQHTQGWYMYLATTRWLGMRVDLFSFTFITAVAFISVGLLSYVSDPSLIGLSLTYTISLTGMFQYVIRQSAEVENVMISSERVMEYSHLEPEASLETLSPEQKPPLDWPNEGELCLEDVAFRYSHYLPLVLKNVSFSVRPSEKIGIVGRTGAGKSSLLSVLYRLAEPLGQITIDGVDTKSIGLHDLRKKMSIIPQDPVLFSGSMRYNLDPFDEYSDAELWEVLEQVQLKAAVKELEGQLSGEVSEGGSNFSVGQRQLVCLARALLRKNKILILDEATANVDPKTDGIIQATIRKNFSDCTVLTIAHRLNTIMDSDKILVMNNGQVIEFAPPISLLQDRKSQFSHMVRKTGPEASQKLYQMTVEAEKRKAGN